MVRPRPEEGMAIANDPQYAFAETDGLPPVPELRVVENGDTLSVGEQRCHPALRCHPFVRFATLSVC